jgi:hypothetical protein
MSKTDSTGKGSSSKKAPAAERNKRTRGRPSKKELTNASPKRPRRATSTNKRGPNSNVDTAASIENNSNEAADEIQEETQQEYGSPPLGPEDVYDLYEDEFHPDDENATSSMEIPPNIRYFEVNFLH